MLTKIYIILYFTLIFILFNDVFDLSYACIAYSLRTDD